MKKRMVLLSALVLCGCMLIGAGAADAASQTQLTHQAITHFQQSPPEEVILTSGMLNPGAPDGLQGTELAQAAFKASLGSAGMAFVAICMLFFAFSTIIGWYFFGEQNVKALFGHKAVKVYAAIVVICIVIGSALHVDLVWNLSDLFNGLMVFPNLIALLALSGLVAKAAHDKDIMK